jgi:hypothetical protein
MSAICGFSALRALGAGALFPLIAVKQWVFTLPHPFPIFRRSVWTPRSCARTTLSEPVRPAAPLFLPVVRGDGTLPP